MRSAFVLVALLSACASPSTSSTSTGVAKAPDLGGFIAANDMSIALSHAADLASFPGDFSSKPADLAMSTSVDLSSSPDLAMSSGCGSVTYAGYCTGNTLTYCYQSQIQTISCANGSQCTTVSGDSDCRYVNGSPCGPVDESGLCDGNTLVYCDTSSNTLVVEDCSSLGYQCDDFSGFADCD